MKLSDVFYEAACMVSNCNGKSRHLHRFACNTIDRLVAGGAWAHITKESREYAKLMGEPEDTLSPYDVEQAAKSVRWTPKDYRTFMLLMASECMRVNGE